MKLCYGDVPGSCGFTLYKSINSFRTASDICESVIEFFFNLVVGFFVIVFILQFLWDV